MREGKRRDNTFAIEKLAAVLAGEGYALWNFAHEFHDLCNVVVVLAITRARSGVEEVITTCDEFEYLGREGLGMPMKVQKCTNDACHAPDVSTCSPLGP